MQLNRIAGTAVSFSPVAAAVTSQAQYKNEMKID